MSKRRSALVALLLGVTALPLVAGDNRFDPTLSPWGLQGQVALPADATLAQTQIASLADERDSLLWVRGVGGYPLVEPAANESALDLGMVSPTVETLRARLILGNDLPESFSAPEGSLQGQTFDFELLQAVQRFQARHGLGSDGVVNADTLQALNIPVERRLEDLDESLQTWKTLAMETSDGEAFLLVNTIEGAVRLFAAGSQHPALTASLHGMPNLEDPEGNARTALSVVPQTGAAHGAPNQGHLEVEHQAALVHAILYTANGWDLSSIQSAVTSATSPVPLLNPVDVHVVALANWVDQGVVRYLDTRTAKSTHDPSPALPPALIAIAHPTAATDTSLPQ